MKSILIILVLFFSIAGFSRQNTESIQSKLKTECTNAEILIFENLKQFKIENYELQNLYSLINLNTIVATSDDYEVAKVSFKNASSIIIEILVYYSPSTNIYFANYQINGQTYCTRLDSKTSDLLTLKKI